MTRRTDMRDHAYKAGHTAGYAGNAPVPGRYDAAKWYDGYRDGWELAVKYGAIVSPIDPPAMLTSDSPDALTDSGPNPKLWADGYGRWHASVPLTDSPARDAATARRLIRAELEERGNGSPITFKVVREHVTNHGTVIYGEPLTGGR